MAGPAARRRSRATRSAPIFTNNLDESTGIHFHGQKLPNNMDGVPHVTQDPIQPGASFTYEFTAGRSGSHMYHSHHNATDQVGRGLLGRVHRPARDEADRVEQQYGVSQDIVWISNDSLGGFTINGRGFPATAPIVATLGDRILIRFMNEGVMMHPWHLHGMPMRIVARDGYDLGAAAFTCDTLGVNPGERWDAVIDCDEPGAWAFHCHILPHAEGRDGMFGMVTALVVQDPPRPHCGQPVERVAGRGGCRRGRIHGPDLPDHVSTPPVAAETAIATRPGKRRSVASCWRRTFAPASEGAADEALELAREPPCRPAHRERHRWGSRAGRGAPPGADGPAARKTRAGSPGPRGPGPPGRRERVVPGLGGRARSRHRRSRRSGAGRPGGCRHAWPQPGRTGRARQRVRPRVRHAHCPVLVVRA